MATKSARGSPGPQGQDCHLRCTRRRHDACRIPRSRPARGRFSRARPRSRQDHRGRVAQRMDELFSSAVLAYITWDTGWRTEVQALAAAVDAQQAG
jgi:hypothetical protein